MKLHPGDLFNCLKGNPTRDHIYQENLFRGLPCVTSESEMFLLLDNKCVGKEHKRAPNTQKNVKFRKAIAQKRIYPFIST